MSLHPSALRLLVARLESASPDTVAVTAPTQVRAAAPGVVAEALAAAWTLELDAAQRTESRFAGPLAADGGCTLLRTDVLRAVHGWPPSRAADTLVTWRLLERGWRVGREPLAVVFRTVPVTATTPAREQAAGARAVHAGTAVAPASGLPRPSSRWLARLDRWGPTLDLVFTAAWVQALVLAGTGRVALLVASVVLAAPLSLVGVTIERRRHADTLEEVGLVLVAPAVWAADLGALDALRAPLAVWARCTQVSTGRRRARPLRRVRRLGGRARPYA